MLSCVYTWVIQFSFFVAARSIRTGLDSKSPHPFLFFDEDDISTLRKRAESTHAEIASRIHRTAQEFMRNPERYLPPKDWKKFASAWNERYGNDLSALAFYCVLNLRDLAARELALQFMDRLESLPNWRVASTLRDDVPVAHSLTGMATAFDFLYPVLNSTQRARFLSKITAVSKELYIRSFDKSLWWGSSYLQNHVATNYMALLTGALVVARNKNTEAKKWVSRANLMLTRNLELLNFVVDGSINEGVAYGTYTSRSLTQFVFLMLRHFQIDLTHGTWIKEHYWFIHYTVLPGFKETVGIGDSHRNWFYGPESQLVFLDNFVLKNGYGNWLARQIRQNKVLKKPLAQAGTHMNCMLHTEFIFYNASIGERALPNPNLPRLWVLSDWGLVTYGGGTGSCQRNTTCAQFEEKSSFLSFKCGVLHGRAINSVVNKKGFRPWISGWKNFNPGHEQPDQGSFVFAPSGLPFITETFYGPKYTWLNNAIVFGPSSSSLFSYPYEGQIGESNQWFDFKDTSAWKAEGEVITASAERGMVFISGEMANWYRPSLGLLSVYRSLVLLTPTTLLVVDHIERKKRSMTSLMGAFFHNVNQPFKLEGSAPNSTYASIELEGLVHKVHWGNTQEGVVSFVQAKGYVSSFKGLKTNYLNVTSPLVSRITRVFYLFSGPGNKVESPQVIISNDLGIKLSVAINGEKYIVSLATRHSLPYSRYRFLGFGGYGKVLIGQNETVRFGVDVVSASAPENSGSAPVTMATAADGYFLSSIALPIIAAAIILLLFYHQLRRKLSYHWKLAIFFLGVLWFFITVAIQLHLCRSKSCPWKSSGSIVALQGQLSLRNSVEIPPFLVYTSLPLAGGEILEQLFRNTSEFFNVQTEDDPFGDDILTGQFAKKFLNPCSLFHRYRPTQKTTQFIKWLRALGKDPKTVLPNLPKKFHNALPTVRLVDPGWGVKLPWVRKVLEPRMRAVVVVRDPRGWVNGWLRELRTDPSLRDTVSETFNALKHHHCLDTNITHFVPEIQIMRKVLTDNKDVKNKDFVSLLSYLWTAHVAAVIHVNSNLPNDRIHFVLFEDLILRPRKTTRRLFHFLGLPLPPAIEHRILQVVRTGSFSLGSSREALGSHSITNWKREMTTVQANQITEICEWVMKKVRYDV